MSTDDGRDDKPNLPAMPAWEAPSSDSTDAESTPAVPAVPEIPEEPAAQAPVTPEQFEAFPEGVVPSSEPVIDQSATREPLGGPYVVSGDGAPIAAQAVQAYDREPQGGPYVTSSEPNPDEPAVERTPYPAAAFAPAPAPAPAAAAGGVAAAPILADGSYPAYQPAPQPVAPVPPAPKGNRGGGTLIALLGTVAFAVIYAAVSFFVISASVQGAGAVQAFVSYLATAAFIIPVLVFAVALILIVLIVNRAGWWAYVLGGFFVAVLVYFGGIAGALIHVQAWGWQPQEQYDFVRSLTMDPLTLAGAVVAREVSIWTGAWIALRGRKVKARNAAAREEFERARSAEAADGAAPIATW
ncbi:hypothetical protein [Herbiconiux sp. YIM B11900]|uniref:hypothetical protein n=1 Tax=Herbiconiux sp. YIM B11900 TaxID=3404131 RepID=UPI003F867B49